MTDHMEMRLAAGNSLATGRRKVEVDVPALAALLDELDALRKSAKPKKIPAERAERREKRRPLPEDEVCARWIFGLILNLNPNARQPPTWTAWGDEIRLMRESDGRTHEQIRDLFRWANADSFWKVNILSPVKLRKHWDQLTIKRGVGGRPALGKAGEATATAAQEWLRSRGNG